MARRLRKGRVLILLLIISLVIWWFIPQADPILLLPSCKPSLDLAILFSDPTICENISTKGPSCQFYYYSIFAAFENNASLCKNINTPSEASLCQGISKRNVTLCHELNSGFKERCLAVAQDDPLLCQPIKTDCTYFVNMYTAFSTKDISKCDYLYYEKNILLCKSILSNDSSIYMSHEKCEYHKS